MHIFFILLIKTYQVVKPIWHSIAISVFGFAPTCKHEESCSDYTIRMIKEHGTISGLQRGWQRVITCWSV